MDLILLPGNSKKNLTWIQEVEDTLAPLFEKTIVQEYAHWEEDGDLIDIEKEQKVLIKSAGSLDKFVVFAKSAGVILALKTIYEGHISPCGCMFVGSAVRWAAHQGFDIDTWIDGYDVPTLFVQKEEDPATSSADLLAYLEEHNVEKFMFKKIPGAEHHYPDIHELKEFMQMFIKKEEK